MKPYVKPDEAGGNAEKHSALPTSLEENAVESGSRLAVPRFLFLAVVALVLVASATPAGAGNTVLEAGKFVERLGEKAIAQLTPKDISKAERVKRMRELLDEAFDVPVIGKFVLGIYWRRATEKQRAEFLELYETVLAHSYAGLFKQYSGEAFTVTKERPVAGGGAIVYGYISQPTGAPIPFELRVKRSSSTHKAVDIKVEGVSMPLTHRKEYSSVIRRSGGKVEGFLEGLRKKAVGLKKSVSAQ